LPKIPLIKEEIEIPNGIEVELKEGLIKVKGPLGTLERKYDPRKLYVTMEDRKITLMVQWPRKKEKAYVYTIASHIRNMFTGVTRGFKKKLIKIHVHFPMRVKVDEKNKVVLIENFAGERKPRVAKIVGDTKVEVEEKSDYIIVRGISKEDVGQTAANICQATRIKDKDPRVFMDGIYVVEED